MAQEQRALSEVEGAKKIAMIEQAVHVQKPAARLGAAHQQKTMSEVQGAQQVAVMEQPVHVQK